MRYQVTKIEDLGFDLLVEIEWHYGWLMRLFGFKSYKRQYRGSGTVWYEYPNARRCWSDMECLLSEVHEEHQWFKDRRQKPSTDSS